ncbi:PREDICTED: proline-rich protein LAS17-like [Priapulus caudatus]|uniref:Proline-rich protein LAS17-like n=1 Tax=Priapulus caudatus TaxID=37621 RepID=A0ABM1EUC7_PRICU|nr:PREDICTED: proline-rich protein LAS17-like [Priapulus caudatus]XP_014675795.1 PREDICTED: proline-rich protein LAS17-like [Priapulus caudatus]XP_014675796.1 PREDICTED: proline-rich protein LAS17-like [Priapulus caudatus]XP_014675797.1 PREDICTED: proline-rich protein LAS17-like [Priapulus caudatus]XP_014675798.1 PREDICTED: proline-rich protein LAS17-like [Priapulus caudatus]
MLVTTYTYLTRCLPPSYPEQLIPPPPPRRSSKVGDASNNIHLPDTLPASLIPRATHPATTQDQQEDKDLLNFEDSMAEGGRTESDGTTPEPGSPQQQHWTTFCDSPTSLASMASSSVSSPGVRPPPMNFDFAPITVDGDSTIVHPIPVKLPMDNPQVEISSDESSLGRTKKPAEPIPYEVLYNAQGQQASPTKPRTHTEPPPPRHRKFQTHPRQSCMIAPPPGGKTPKKPG